MTQNQIAYFKAVNDVNMAREQLAETKRSNRAKEELEKSSQRITEGHYIRSDAINQGNLLVNQAAQREKERSDRANESISMYKARADAALSYATASLRGEEVALRKEEQSLTKQKTKTEAQNTELAKEKVVSEAYGQYLSEAQAQRALAERDYTQQQQKWIVVDKLGSLLGGAGKLAGGLSH
jgi:hypothetical protein